MDLNFLNIYDALQIVYRTDDDKFRIEGIEAIKFYEKIFNNANQSLMKYSQKLKVSFKM